MGLATVSDATGVTNIAATEIRIATGEGTLVVEVDDPNVTVTIEGDYSDTLPALNLVFDLSEDWLLRLGVAEVMARPSLGANLYNVALVDWPVWS